MMNKVTPLPEAYQIGSVPFIDTQIFLDSRPLIPRPETEYWVNEVIKKLPKNKALRILDLCAGSGAIGIAVANALPLVNVDFAEIEPGHLRTIKGNLEENGIHSSRYRIFGGDLFERVKDTYDLILSNPPYVDMKLGRVAPEVLEHEPHQAIDGGSQGLRVINRIITEAPNYLASDGTLYLEHEPEQIESLSTNPLYINTYKDQYGVPRFSSFSILKAFESLGNPVSK